MGMQPKPHPGNVVYVEPLADYIGRKHFYIALPVAGLVLILAVEVLAFPGSVASPAMIAIQEFLVAALLAALFLYRGVWRFKRFRIYDDGLILPGSRTGPSGARFVRFDDVASVEAIAWPDRNLNRLLYVQLKARWPKGDSSVPANVVIETTIDAEAIGRKCLVRLWKEWVDRGIATEESLRLLSTLR